MTEGQHLAFISYSRSDGKVARLLQRKLEQYVLPKSLRVSRPNTRFNRRPLRPIFRDEDELVAGPNLPERIQHNLERSEFLIVLCSRNSAKSEWVEQEILTFIKLGREDHILAVVVDGEPNAVKRGFPLALECLPNALRFGIHGKRDRDEAEPLWVDWRHNGHDQHKMFLRLVAALLGLSSLDELIQRDAQARTRRAAAWIGGSIGTSAAVMALMFVAWSLTYASVAYQTTRFRNFYEAELRSEIAELFTGTGYDMANKLQYRLVLSDDLNTDGAVDFIVINQTQGFYGNAGYPFDIYLGKRFGGFTKASEDQLGFGRTNVLAIEGKGTWKDLLIEDRPGVYERSVYDLEAREYTEVGERWVCGTTTFNYCDYPVVFCWPDQTTQAYIKDGAKIFTRPDPYSDADPPDGVPDVYGVTPDGSWFILVYEFSSTGMDVYFARPEDVEGDPPMPGCFSN